MLEQISDRTWAVILLLGGLALSALMVIKAFSDPEPMISILGFVIALAMIARGVMRLRASQIPPTTPRA
ncbi:MAG TPA: hypothetical protein VIU61_15670 [Kofleriaceae bacterium]